ncbi:DUF899 family protein [Glaciimonas sp. PCH181]|uniref:DUF899 family protein n=1 Tax=Glaciimonas sp. PCH181 TaxID=2133943 RepID=UPI000D35C545|nr:DUF899 family protein [Glaciimonas sp. PCH181]PUA17180.1 DUF899 domain-containing protein [Glaciimonas sp. PCH181]
METSLHSIRFPGESNEYRVARDALLQAELDLRKQVEKVAELRREMPVGGLLKEDYVFEQASIDPDSSDTGKKVRLSALFQEGKDSLLIYSFMYSPNMQRPCPSCTSILDGLNGAMPHVLQRVNFAVVAKSPIQRIQAFAQERGWQKLPLLSSAHNSFNTDYHGETANGGQNPVLNVFVKREGQIYHTYCTELLFAQRNPGQDPRHVDAFWPLWNLLDLTPEGRGTDWRPALTYDQA